MLNYEFDFYPFVFIKHAIVCWNFCGIYLHCLFYALQCFYSPRRLHSKMKYSEFFQRTGYAFNSLSPSLKCGIFILLITWKFCISKKEWSLCYSITEMSDRLKMPKQDQNTCIPKVLKCSNCFWYHSCLNLFIPIWNLKINEFRLLELWSLIPNPEHSFFF